MEGPAELGFSFEPILVKFIVLVGNVIPITEFFTVLRLYEVDGEVFFSVEEDLFVFVVVVVVAGGEGESGRRVHLVKDGGYLQPLMVFYRFAKSSLLSLRTESPYEIVAKFSHIPLRFIREGIVMSKLCR